MKKTVITTILFALAACSALAADDPDKGIVGHAWVGDDEYEFYETASVCDLKLGQRTKLGGFRMSRYPKGRRSEYTMGCWEPVGSEFMGINFDNGSTILIHRGRFVPTGTWRFTL